jgi:hypothetical protein
MEKFNKNKKRLSKQNIFYAKMKVQLSLRKVNMFTFISGKERQKIVDEVLSDKPKKFQPSRQHHQTQDVQDQQVLILVLNLILALKKTLLTLHSKMLVLGGKLPCQRSMILGF